MARNQDIKRQAVVIIHGIGEQRPMDTLRSFVEGLTYWIKQGDPQAERPRYWSRPDGISEIYETHRITMEQFQMNPKTDFYEFYWAHHMRNMSFAHLLPWVWKLITTRPSQVPPRLKPIFNNIWSPLVVGAVLGGRHLHLSRLHLGMCKSKMAFVARDYCGGAGGRQGTLWLGKSSFQ